MHRRTGLQPGGEALGTVLALVINLQTYGQGQALGGGGQGAQAGLLDTGHAQHPQQGVRRVLGRDQEQPAPYAVRFVLVRFERVHGRTH